MKPGKHPFWKVLFNSSKSPFFVIDLSCMTARPFWVFMTFLLGLFVFDKKVEASLVKVDKNGEIVVNVLSVTSDGEGGKEVVEMPKIEGIESNDYETGIYIKKDGEAAVLGLREDGRVFDVTRWNGDLIELEERQDKKITVSLKDGKFFIDEEGFNVSTDLPIEVKTKKREISVGVDGGEVYLAVLPLEAAKTALRSKKINVIKEASLIKRDAEAFYKMDGERVFDVFGVVKYTVPVSTELSVSTGEMTSISEPVWLKIVGSIIG